MGTDVISLRAFGVSRSTRFRDLFDLAADLLNDRVFPVCDSHEVTKTPFPAGSNPTAKVSRR
jgi:hypothetical protein